MKAAIYARYSSTNQREESIEGQLRECHDFANKNNIVIIGDNATGLYRVRRINARSSKR